MSDYDSDETLPMPSEEEIAAGILSDMSRGDAPGNSSFYGPMDSPGFRDMTGSPTISAFSESIDDTEVFERDPGRYEALGFSFGTIAAPRGFFSANMRLRNRFEAEMLKLRNRYEGQVPFVKSDHFRSILMNVRNPNARSSIESFKRHLATALDEARARNDELDLEMANLRRQDTEPSDTEEE